MRPLVSKEKKPAIAQQKEDEAKAKFEKKIAVLKLFKKEGIPEKYLNKDNKYNFRLNLTGFREWTDADLGVERIGSSSTIYDKNYAVYIVEINDLILSLKYSCAPKKKVDQLAKLKQELENERVLVQDLTNQVHMLRHELNSADSKLKRTENKLQAARSQLKNEGKIVRLVHGGKPNE